MTDGLDDHVDPFSLTTDEARQVGWTAGARGRGPEACPYKPTDALGQAWRLGHTEGRWHYARTSGAAEEETERQRRAGLAHYRASAPYEEAPAVVEVGQQRYDRELKARREYLRAKDRARRAGAAADAALEDDEDDASFETWTAGTFADIDASFTKALRESIDAMLKATPSSLDDPFLRSLREGQRLRDERALRDHGRKLTANKLRALDDPDAARVADLLEGKQRRAQAKADKLDKVTKRRRKT